MTPPVARRPARRPSPVTFALAILGLAGTPAIAPALRAQMLPAAQQPAPSLDTRRFELRPFVGAFLPYGAMHEVAADAFMLGGTAAYAIDTHLRATGTLAWADSRARRFSGANHVDVFQYDAGLEYVPASLRLFRGRIQPVLSGGLGARTYSFRDLDIGTQTNFAGYLGTGVEFDISRIAVRVGARNYWTDFKYIAGDRRARGRNDVMLGTAIGIRF